MKNNKIIKALIGTMMAATMTVGGASGSLPCMNTNDVAIVADAAYTAYCTGNFYKGCSWTNWISVKPTNPRNECEVKVAAYQENGRCNGGKFEVQIWSSSGRYVNYVHVKGSERIKLNYGYSGYNLRIRRTDTGGINTSKTIHWAVTEAGWYNIDYIGSSWNSRY